MKKTWISRRRRRPARSQRRRKKGRAWRLGRGLGVAFLLLGVSPALPIGLMRFVPPLGSALMGRDVGDTVSYEAPGGKLSVTITAIEG